MGVGAVLCVILLAIAVRPEPEALEPVNVGRFQIVTEPSGIVLKIDTDSGFTERLVRYEPTGTYTWERVE